jgi:glutathione S-transferase
MITLYGSSTHFGLPEASPFVMKIAILLKMAGLDYKPGPSDFKKAPKGKIPFINDNGTLIADSTFIRFYLEDKYKIDFNKGLNAEQIAIGWAVEKLCEEQIYWIIVQDRWMNEENFQKGPIEFFKTIPSLIRPLITGIIRRGIRKSLHGQGTSRFSQEERNILAKHALSSISTILGSKPWLLADTPSAADASVASFIAGTLCPLFDTDLLKIAQQYPNLTAYRDRAFKTFFPNFQA